MTQADRVLEYIGDHGEITSREAMDRLGIVQLPRRIHDLKGRGYSVTREWRTAKNRYGDTVRYGVYKVEA